MLDQLTYDSYKKAFDELFKKVEASKSQNQEKCIIEFLKYLLLGYEKEFIDIKDLGAWCSSVWVVARSKTFSSHEFLEGLNKIGGGYGDAFDFGEKEVKEVWKMDWDEAEKEMVLRLKKFINRYIS